MNVNNQDSKECVSVMKIKTFVLNQRDFVTIEINRFAIIQISVQLNAIAKMLTMSFYDF